MSVTNEQVRHIAKLARIAMSDEELERLVPELNNILGWVEQLGEVNTDGVEPLDRRDREQAAPSRGQGDGRQLPGRHPRQCAGRRAWVLRCSEGDRVTDLTAKTIARASRRLSRRRFHRARGCGAVQHGRRLGSCAERLHGRDSRGRACGRRCCRQGAWQRRTRIARRHSAGDQGPVRHARRRYDGRKQDP